jgi:tRNA pseudouridine55 synthase
METQVDATYPTEHLTESLLLETTKQFLGEIDQKPPVFSAIKKDGIRMYELARAGEAVEIQARKTTVYEFEITRIALPEVDFRICCSKGTYIRSLAYDYGKALQSGGYLSVLRRTKIGDYSVTAAITPEAFEARLAQ